MFMSNQKIINFIKHSNFGFWKQKKICEYAASVFTTSFLDFITHTSADLGILALSGNSWKILFWEIDSTKSDIVLIRTFSFLLHQIPGAYSGINFLYKKKCLFFLRKGTYFLKTRSSLSESILQHFFPK